AQKEATATPAKAPVKKASAPKRKKSTTATTKAPAPTTAMTGWQIRSAQPGKALLAQGGSSDVLSVEVGDSVRGLGKITAIGLENGVWRVQGTQGSVTR